MYAVSLLSTQHLKVRAKTGWSIIRIMFPSGEICQSIVELVLQKSH
jgi:hypothetical protein